jgi:hypothetical protein
MTPLGAAWHLVPDYWVTRNKRRTYIEDADHNVRWNGQYLTEALDFLIAEGQLIVEVKTGHQHVRLHIHPIPDPPAI